MAGIKIDLDFELFHLRNPAMAQSVVIAVLTGNDREAQGAVLNQVQVEDLWPPFKRFLFEVTAEMLSSQGFVDIERLRQGLVEFASSGSPEFVQGCLANFDQILSLEPAPAHVEKALQIIEYNRARHKTLRLMDELSAMRQTEEERVLPDLEHWLQERGWTEKDVQEVTRHLGDRGEKAVWFWSRLRRLHESNAQEMIQLLRRMGAF
jgi:hypothetical protein